MLEEDLDVTQLGTDALETLASRPCHCRRAAARVDDVRVPVPAVYVCLAHRAIAELEQRERKEAERA